MLGLFRIKHAGYLAKCHGLFDDLRDVGLALHAIAVQNGVRSQPSQHKIELPNQIIDVANTGTHTLPEKRRHQMRRIADKKHSARPPFACVRGSECIYRGSDQLSIVRREPFRHQRPHVLRAGKLCRIVSGQYHEFEAAVSFTQLKKTKGPARIANLAVVEVKGERALLAKIDDQPTLTKREFFKLDLGRGASEAVGSIGTDQIAAAHSTALG